MKTATVTSSKKYKVEATGTKASGNNSDYFVASGTSISGSWDWTPTSGYSYPENACVSEKAQIRVAIQKLRREFGIQKPVKPARPAKPAKHVSRLCWAEVALASKQLGERNDCTVKAVAITGAVSYEKAHELMEQAGRRRGRGAYTYQYHAVLKGLGYTIEKIDHVALGIKTMVTAGKALKNGVYLVNVSRHVAAVVNGTVEDWSKGSRRRVEAVYRITKN